MKVSHKVRLMVARQKPSDIEQIWLVPYPRGTPRRITIDLNSYRDISITSDSSKFVTVRVDYQSSVWLAPEGDSKRAVELPTGNIGFLTWGSDNALSWAPDGHVIYVSFGSGSPEIWMMDSNGDNRRQITNGGYNVAPSVSPDGRYISCSFPAGRARTISGG
jgi:tricorn protease-like protein